MFFIQFFKVPGYEFGNANSKIKKFVKKIKNRQNVTEVVV